MTQENPASNERFGVGSQRLPDIERGSQRRRIRAIELSLFLSLWFVFGIAINPRNLGAFNLQQIGVEAMVERRQLSLEGSSSPRLQPSVSYVKGRVVGDVFLFDGKPYAAKQPGQSILGAIVYFVLRLLGFSYVDQYLLTSALVTLFTTSMITAAAGVAVFGIVREFIEGPSLSWPLGCALAFALGTTAFVYSGISHHEPIASALLVIAFYAAILIRKRRPQGRVAKLCAGGAGLLLGLVITTSMVPFFMVFVVGVYLALLRRKDLILPVLIGVVAGLAPLLVFDLVAFGNPLLLPNFAGGYTDTTPHFDLHNFAIKTRFFARSLTIYVPVVWVGVFGLAFYPRELRREQFTILGLLVALAFVVLDIDTEGGCQYGPRYLLPAMPFACIGLVGFHYLRGRTGRSIALVAVGLVAAASILISSVGAFHGAMICVLEQYALQSSFAALSAGELRDLPLARWLMVPLLASLGLLAYSVQAYRRTSKLEL